MSLATPVAKFCEQWGIRRDPIAEDLVVELKGWQNQLRSGPDGPNVVWAGFDPAKGEARLVWPEGHPKLQRGNKAWRKFRDRFAKYSGRVAVYVGHKHWHKVISDAGGPAHLRAAQLCHRIFPGIVIESHVARIGGDE